jgi:hypothetical protein
MKEVIIELKKQKELIQAKLDQHVKLGKEILTRFKTANMSSESNIFIIEQELNSNIKMTFFLKRSMKKIDKSIKSLEKYLIVD